MSIPETERATLSKHLRQAISGTPYKCSAIVALAGGSVNFVYRGVLQESFIDNDDKSTHYDVLIKHAAGHLSCNRDYLIEISRWDHEVYMLDALRLFNVPPTPDGIVVTTPKLLLSDKQTYTQVLEYVPHALDLRQKLTTSSDDFSPAVAASTGFALGQWLRRFHDWSSQDSQSELQRKVQQNEAMREHKYVAEYGNVSKVLANFPEVLATHRAGLDAVLVEIDGSYKSKSQLPEEDWGVIHGDFWGGNMISSSASQPAASGQSKLYIIDWECVQYGPRAHDLGQMVADCLERQHFKASITACDCMEGFVRGYGLISEALSFRAAIHAGTHMIGWYTRRDPNGPLPAPLDVAAEFMEEAAELIVRAHQKDKKWLERSSLSCLFVPSEMH